MLNLRLLIYKILCVSLILSFFTTSASFAAFSYEDSPDGEGSCLLGLCLDKRTIVVLAETPVPRTQSIRIAPRFPGDQA